MSTSTSNIRVFVSFGDKGAVFAGENVECTITFKNIAPVPGLSRSSTMNGHPMGSGSLGGSSDTGESMFLPNGSERRIKNPPSQLLASDKARPSGARMPSEGGGSRHRPSLSLSVPNRRSYSNPNFRRSSVTTTMNGGLNGSKPLTPMMALVTTPGLDKKHQHKRSISIMSIGSDRGDEMGTRSPGRRPGLHSRNGSMSVPIKRPMSAGGPNGGANGSAPNSGGFLHDSTTTCFAITDNI